MKVIAIALLSAQIFAQQPNGASVAGRVTGADGKPVAKATLLLMGGLPGPNGAPPQPYRSTTAADGSYSFAGVDPGLYNLQALRVGYAPGHYAVRGNQLRLAAGQKVTDIDITLTLAGSISGAVSDENGDPVAGVSIRLWRQTRDADGTLRFVGYGSFYSIPGYGNTTDNSGHYKLDNVEPGTYYVTAGGRNGGGTNTDTFEIFGLGTGLASYSRSAPRPGQRLEAYVTTWYPRAEKGESASAVEVTSGHELPKIDIQLRKTPLFRLKGTLTSSITGHPLERMRVNLLNKDGQNINFSGPIINFAKDGSFELDGLVPGSYYVAATDPASGSNSPLARRKVEIADKDVDGFVLAMSPLAELRGTVTLDGKPLDSGPAPAGVQLVSLETPQVPAAVARVERDGTFTMPNVISGAYSLRMATQARAYTASVLLGSAEVADTAFNLAAGPATMKITLVSATGGIRARAAPGPNGVTTNCAIIVPVSETPGVTWRYKQIGRADSGVFVFDDLPPGVYRIFGMGPVDQNTFDPATLKPYESQSVKVTVDGSEPVFTALQSISAPAK